MTKITDESEIEARTFAADCAPIFESIIAQFYIGAIWCWSNAGQITFDASVHKQFVGVMHEGTKHETTWTEPDCGMIEDGNARKGELMSAEYFTDFTEALDHLMSETKRLVALQYGGLDKIAV